MRCDTVFADYYFRAQDRWRAGAVGDVPPAWRIAFRAADRREVTGMGDALLGMNAHINRDLPFVLNAVGVVAPDGNVALTTIDERVHFTLVQAWREAAWRNAELLRLVSTLAEKLQVARLIEDEAAAAALVLRTAFLYGPLRSSASRDAYCARVN